MLSKRVGWVPTRLGSGTYTYSTTALSPRSKRWSTQLSTVKSARSWDLHLFDALDRVCADPLKKSRREEATLALTRQPITSILPGHRGARFLASYHARSARFCTNRPVAVRPELHVARQARQPGGKRNLATCQLRQFRRTASQARELSQNRIRRSQF